MKKLIVMIALALAPAAFADTITENATGVKFESEKSVDGKAFVLTGAGVRKKFNIAKVYALGMYIEKDQAKRDYQSFKTRPNADPYSFIVWGNFDKFAVMHFVRDVDAGKIRNAFQENLGEELSDKAPADVKKATEDFLALVDKDVKDGDEIILSTSNAGKISLQIGGAKKEGPQNVKLSRALWNIWLGAKPISPDIKKNAVSRLDTLSQ